MKQRLMFGKLVEFIEKDKDYNVAILTGIRRTGKTFLLNSLKDKYGKEAVYIDLTEQGSSLSSIQERFDESVHRILLLDEIASLKNYEPIAQMLFDFQSEGVQRKPKIIMTGSSAAHLVKLNGSKLGCRARLFRMPLLNFVEFLYFTDRIQSYDDYESVANADFADYLQLKGLKDSPASDLAITFDEDYFMSFYDEVELCNRKSKLTHSLTELQENDLRYFINILAYKLSEPSRYKETTEAVAGAQEHIHLYNQQIKVKLNQIDFSDTVIFDSLKVVPDITIESIGRILLFLLWSGIATVEQTRRYLELEPYSISSILGKIEISKTRTDLENIFKDISVCLVSPLFYTRIGEEILQRMNVSVDNLYKGMIYGKMLELYIRGALSTYQKNSILSSNKLNLINLGEIDIYDNQNRILCESSVADKSDEETSVYKYFPDHEFIRVCSSAKKDYFSEKLQYYQIPYAKLCCMLDTGDILKLKRTICIPCSK